MPSYCANQIINYLKKDSKNLENIKIAILGYSFKNNSGDVRFTPVKNFIEILFELGCNQISIFDSAISAKETLNKNLIRTQNWQECIENADVVVFGAAHDDISSIKIEKLVKLLNKNPLIFDGRRYFAKNEIDDLLKLGVTYLGVGRSFV